MQCVRGLKKNKSLSQRQHTERTTIILSTRRFLVNNSVIWNGPNVKEQVHLLSDFSLASSDGGLQSVSRMVYSCVAAGETVYHHVLGCSLSFWGSCSRRERYCSRHRYSQTANCQRRSCLKEKLWIDQDVPLLTCGRTKRSQIQEDWTILAYLASQGSNIIESGYRPSRGRHLIAPLFSLNLDSITLKQFPFRGTWGQWLLWH